MRASNEKDMPVRRRVAAAILTTPRLWGLGQRKLMAELAVSRWVVEDVLARLLKAGLIPPREGAVAFKTAKRRYRGGYEVDRSDPAKFRVLYSKKGNHGGDE